MKTFFPFLACFILLLLAFFFSTCGKNKLVTDVCFSKNILPIFVSKCTTSGCHVSKTSGQQKGTFDLSNYEAIMKKVTPYHPLLSSAYTECRGNNPSMPPKSYPQLTETELEYIRYWIHTGAKNTNDCATNACDTINVSFTNRVLPILNSWCTGCHSPTNPGGGYDLTTYNGVKVSISPNNRLSGCIEQLPGFSAMPKSGKLDYCDIRAIEKWIDAGYPNN